MFTLTAIFATLFGLAFGSFLNVCISRLPRHESIAHPPSRCPNCHQPIQPRDNIPVLSWRLLKGKCRSCQWPIPIRYPLIEAATAALFLLCYLEFGLTLHAIAATVLCWLLLGLAITDAETLLLPDTLTLPGIALGILASSLDRPGNPALPAPPLHFNWTHTAQATAWALAAAALILCIRWLYWLLRRQEGLGLGDAKLLAMIAAWQGPEQTALTFFLAVLAAALYGVAKVTTRKANPAKAPTQLPLGAFLSAAAIFTLFQGEKIIHWYLAFFH